MRATPLILCSALGLAIGIADHRDHESVLRADGDADVVEVLYKDIRALDLRVKEGERLERSDGRLRAAELP